MNEGWICPKCNRVFSPNVLECISCNSINKLTATQKNCFIVYSKYIEEKGFAPTFRELGLILGIAPSCAFNLVRNIKKKGFTL